MAHFIVALPVDVHSAYATYGTQFGVVERPTHRNTTIDQAKFFGYKPQRTILLRWPIVPRHLLTFLVVSLRLGPELVAFFDTT